MPSELLIEERERERSGKKMAFVIAYIDSSVLLRIVLGEPNPLAEWDQIDAAACRATLLAVEVHRTLDRLLASERADRRRACRETRRDIADSCSALECVALDDQVLASRVAAVRRTSLATLDAIHLATAILYRAIQPPDERPLLFATHDSQLARAARAMNFEVIGA